MKTMRKVEHKIEITVCDICDVEVKPKERYPVLVKYLSEQTEGRSVTPYAETVSIDLCATCHGRYIDELPIMAWGAQGYHNFKWNTKEVAE